MKLRCFAIAISMAVIGCTPVATVNLTNPSASETGLSVRDLRPQTECESNTFSLIITNPAYAIFRYGDERIVPNKIRLLQHRVFEQMALKSISATKHELKVHHFVVYDNTATHGKAVAAGAAFGPVISEVVKSNSDSSVPNRSSFEVPPEMEYTRGTFTQADNPRNATVFIVYLDAEIDGKRAFVRYVHPYNQGFDATNKAQHVEAVEKTIEKFLSNYMGS